MGELAARGLAFLTHSRLAEGGDRAQYTPCAIQRLTVLGLSIGLSTPPVLPRAQTLSKPPVDEDEAH